MKENILIILIIIFLILIIVLFFHLFLIGRKKKFNRDSIYEHPFFNKMNFLLHVSVNKLEIGNNQRKTLIAKKFLRIKIEGIITNFKILLKRYDEGEKITGNDINECITNIVLDYESKALENGIPKIFIDRFSEWHNAKIIMIQDSINFIYNSKIYHNDLERISTILEIILTTIHITFSDIDLVMNAMNGELDKILNEKIKL